MDHSILFAFLLTALAGLSTGIGGLIALVSRRTSRKFLSVALGFSAGVMVYVSMTDILEKAREFLTGALGGKGRRLGHRSGFFRRHAGDCCD